MVRSLLSFCLGFFKSRTRLQLEIVYLVFSILDAP